MKNTVWFLIIVGLAYGVLATQPALPTTLYGKVANNGGTPAVGTEITATWTDADGIQKTVTTSVLSRSQAETVGNPSYEGHYLFNQGYINAPAGNEIVIGIKNQPSSKNILANPGGAIIKVETIVVEGQGGKQPSGTTSGTGSGGGQGGGGGEGDGGSGTGTGGSGTGGGNGEGSGQAIGGAEQGSDTGTGSSKGSGSQPFLPTTIFGKLVDDEDNPLPNEEVIAEWVDQQGIKHATSTKTLSKKEAKALGNKSLEGYYLFNKGDITASANSTIKLYMGTQGQNVKNVTANPGRNVEARVHSVLAALPRKPDPIIKSAANKVLNSTGIILAKAVVEKDDWKKILFLIATGFIVLLFWKRQILAENVKRIIKKTKSPLYRSINKLLNVKGPRMMAKEVAIISPQDTLQEALELLVGGKRRTVVVVQNKKPIGIITERTLLSATTKNLAQLKVSKYMETSFTPLDHDAAVDEIITALLKSTMHDVLIVRNGQLKGAVSITDFLKFFYEYSIKNTIESQDTPTVRELRVKNMTLVRKTEKLSSVRDKMVQSNTEYAIIIDKNGTNKKKPCLGVVTIETLLHEYYKNPQSLTSLNVEHVMSYPMLTINPSTDVFEANKIMMDIDYRTAGVITYDKTIGVVTERALLKALHDFLSRMATAIIENVEKGRQK